MVNKATEAETTIFKQLYLNVIQKRRFVKHRVINKVFTL